LSWRDDEKEFQERLENVTLSTRYQNMHEHWDMQGSLIGEKEIFKFDVKGLKRFNRRFEEDRGLPIQDEMMLVEWQNVNGNRGSILGVADKIAQKRKKYPWLIVPRQALWEMVKPKLNQKDITAPAEVPWNFKKEPYVVCDRIKFINKRTGKPNNDRFAWVPYEDIETLKDVEKLDK
jgi:hypothetical protein